MSDEPITYITETVHAVYLGKKRVGQIVEITAKLDGGTLYQYVRRGGNDKGDLFTTLAACKASLEA